MWLETMNSWPVPLEAQCIDEMLEANETATERLEPKRHENDSCNWSKILENTNET